MHVVVRHFGGARDTSGTPEETLDITPGSTLSALVLTLGRLHGPGMARVLASASFLVDEVSVTGDPVLSTGATVDVLPPFAGG